MNALAPRPLPHMTADEFLAWPGDGSARKHQLFDGEVRSMAPASSTHGFIQANVAFLIGAAIRAGDLPLIVATEGAIVPGLNAATNVRVPDLVVSGAPDERGQQAVPDPVLLVEILSPGNQDDTRDNLRAYATLPSVTEMVLLKSARLLAEIYRRDARGVWLPDPDIIEAGGRLVLASVGLDCPLEDAYRGTWLLRPRRP